MTTWKIVRALLDAKAYENLLLRQQVLKVGKPDITMSGTMRYILRRIRFSAEDKRLFLQRRAQIADESQVRQRKHDDKELVKDAGFNVDPWSFQRLEMKVEVMRMDYPGITRAEVVRRVLRRLRFTQEQRDFFLANVHEIMRQDGIEPPR